MQKLWHILCFRIMVAPYLLQLLFWAGVGGCLYGGYVLWSLDQPSWPLPLIFGPLLLRVLFERALIAFKTYDRQGEIITLLQHKK